MSKFSGRIRNAHLKPELNHTNTNMKGYRDRSNGIHIYMHSPHYFQVQVLLSKVYRLVNMYICRMYMYLEV